MGLCPLRLLPPPRVAMQSRLKSTFVQRDGRCWDEKIEIMTEEWEASGWKVASISTLRMQSAYKVTIDYQKPQEGKPPDEFFETLWRSQQADWKPTGSKYKPEEPRFVYMSWWLREPSKPKANDLDQSFKRLRCEQETPDSPSAPSRVDLAMTDDDPLGQTQVASSGGSDNSSESSSVLLAPIKRARTKDDDP